MDTLELYLRYVLMLKLLLKKMLSSLGILEQIKYLRDRKHPSIKNFDKINSQIGERSSKNNVLKAAIVPAAHSPGGLGDEALIKGITSFISKKNIQIFPIGLSKDDAWPFLADPITVIPSKINDWQRFSDSIASLDQMYIVGADVMDGGYGIHNSALRLQIAAVAAKTGLDVTITGFSFNNNCPKIIIDLFRKLPKSVKICTRDPESKARFDKATGLESKLTADVAFHMPPQFESLTENNNFKWLEQTKQLNKKVLGVNICPHSVAKNFGKHNEKDLFNLITLYEKALTNFLNSNQNYSVLLMPHDYRGILSDLNLSLILCNRLKRIFGSERINVIDTWIHADEIKAFSANVDIVFTGRMHLAIASISMGTPVACFTYQNKFEGLFQMIDLDSSLLSSASEQSIDKFTKTLQRLADEEVTLRQSLQKSIHKLADLSSNNFIQNKAQI
jgi:polysaccharide pyruvyl transferase WcaK-like protein